MAKIPVGIRIESELIERLKNAVWHLGRGLTITSVITKSLEDSIRELEAQNGGKPFPARTGRLAKSPTPVPKKKKK